VQAQDTDPRSTLTLFRDALRVRREHPDLGDGELRWLDNTNPSVLSFSRGGDLVCVVNIGGAAVELPEHAKVLVASDELTDDGLLPGDAAVWLATA
jgi:alpha-glucosidase